MDWEFPLEDKIVVVTGGGSGIGLSFALLARKQSSRAVIIADISLTQDAKNAIGEDDKLIFLQCDVTKWSDLQHTIDFSIERFGDVPDVFVASAGVFEPPYSNFWDDPEPISSDGYKSVDINVNHPIKLTRLAIRSLLGKDKRGVVVIVGSIAGYSKQYPAPIYSATKHAIVGFTRSLGDAQQLQGVKVVAVCPGIISTPIWTEGTPGAGERFGITEDVSITAEPVAQIISQAIQSPEYPGGTILEISKVGTRVVPEWLIEPPGMIDGKLPKGTDVPQEMIQKALGPILQRTAAEKAGAA